MHQLDFEYAKKWLADAPLFIDADQVERFFDAVVRPESKLSEWTYTLSDEKTKELVSKIDTELKTGGGPLLALWAELKLKAGFGLEQSRGSGQTISTEQVYNPIYTPQRQLISLAEYYQRAREPRSVYVTKPVEPYWRNQSAISEPTRELVFLDLPGQVDATGSGALLTKLIPVAAEFANGQIVPFFLDLRARNGENPPSEYPESQYITNADDLQSARKQYWLWFSTNFQVQASIRAVETAAQTHGRIQWIDFRLPITDEGETLHLHISPAGRYDTGVFAYNFIRRGFEYGLRIVGTMKSDPDMDVLAVYDK